ncbi:hypothetical protein BH11PLA1_BH11PLA1_07890 [soil metagenome]
MNQSAPPVCSLLFAAGLTLALSLPAHAQTWNVGPLSGPYTSSRTLAIRGVNLNGPSAPAGTYGTFTAVVDWSTDVTSADPPYQTDQRISFSSMNPQGLMAPAGVVYRSLVPPSTAAFNENPGTIRWDGLPFTTSFVANGANQIYMGIATDYAALVDSTWTNVMLTFTGPTGPCVNLESEPNEPKVNADVFSAASGNRFCGVSMGMSDVSANGIATYDYYRVQAAPHAGIRKHRMRFSTTNVGQFATSRIITQTNGVANPATDLYSTFHDDVPGNYFQWYTFGTSADSAARSEAFRVGGSETSPAQYEFNVLLDEAVVPATLSRNVTAGSVTITTTGGMDTEVMVMDAGYDIIPGYLNDDQVGTATGNSSLTRTFTAGTYYIGVAPFSLEVSEVSPLDDGYRNGYLNEFPGVAQVGQTGDAQGSVPLAGFDLSFNVIDSTGTISTPAVTAEPEQILFYQMTVAAGATVTRCQPADIADDQGNPLPPPPGVPNNGVNEGDYNLFFNSFFTNQAIGSPADIASDDGTPLPPFGPAGLPNNGVNEGDYNAFFNNFFNGCPV